MKIRISYSTLKLEFHCIILMKTHTYVNCEHVVLDAFVITLFMENLKIQAIKFFIFNESKLGKWLDI